MNKIKQILDAYYRGVYSERETLHRIASVLDTDDVRPQRETITQARQRVQKNFEKWRDDPATPQLNAVAARIAALVTDAKA